MANKLQLLRRENNKIEKQLSKENNVILTDIISYLFSSRLREYDIQLIRRDLIGMALEAQLRGENLRDVVGEDYKEFCSELMKSGREKTKYDSVLLILYTLIVGFASMYILDMIFSSAITNIVKNKSYSISINLGFVISAIMITAAAHYFFWYISNKTFELTNSKKVKVLYTLKFFIVIVAFIIIMNTLNKIILFTVNWFYPPIFLIAAFVIVKWMENKHMNKITA